jgi:hypothetical protein
MMRGGEFSTPQVFDGGCVRKKEIILLYEAAEEALFPSGAKLVLININRTIENPELALYDAVRYSWKISRRRAEGADYVLAVAHGLIVEVFEADEWLPAREENFPDVPASHGNWEHQDGRSGFRGRKGPDDVRKLYVNKRVPKRLRKRGAAGPIRYVGI